jgi:hypothetical protein
VADQFTPTFGGYWAWTTTQDKPGWAWFNYSPDWPTWKGMDASMLTFPGHPFNGNPDSYFNPAVTPDGNKVDNPGFIGPKWPGPDGKPDGADNKNYVPKDVPIPGLQATPGAAPVIDGHPWTGQSSGDPNPNMPGDVEAFRVHPGTLREAEIAINASADAVVGAHNTLKPKLDEARGEFAFFTGLKGTLNPDTHWLNLQLVNGGDILAKSVADTVRLVGEFTASLNNAGQLYAKADRDSFLTDPAAGAGDTPA